MPTTDTKREDEMLSELRAKLHEMFPTEASRVGFYDSEQRTDWIEELIDLMFPDERGDRRTRLAKRLMESEELTSHHAEDA